MNHDHATVNYAGKYRVATFVPDLMYPLQMTTEFSGKEDFMNINVTPLVGKVGRGKYFLHHPKRENYDGVQFAPGRPAEIEVVDKNGKVHRQLNLYSGFSVEPKSGDCALYLKHLYDNVCNVAENGIEPYEYLLNLMAYHVQHPDDPQRVSVSLRGIPGTGKGIAVTEFGKIFGRHFVHMTNKVHLVGKFNAHLAEAMFEFADETLNMNDPEIEALMKTHVSERTKLIERKGIDVVQTPSYSVTWFATNDQHPINIDTGDRRYYPLHVNPACAKNKPYFTAIIEQMRDGGLAALLDFLLKRDVTDFNAEKMPWTKELQLQKNMSVNEKDALIIDWANYGHLPGFLERMPWVAKSGELLRAMREGGGRELKLMSDQKLADVLKSWGFQRHSLKTGGGWRAPPLEQLQAEIVRRFPGTVWDHPEIVAWAGLADAQEEAKGRKKDEDERAAKAQTVMELQAQRGL